MSYRIEYTPAAVRDLKNLDAVIRRRVFEDIERLRDNRRPHGVEKLEAKEKLYRIHVGPGKNYRVIHQIQDEALVVLVVRVGHRKDVYRRMR